MVSGDGLHDCDTYGLKCLSIKEGIKFLHENISHMSLTKVCKIY